MFPCRRAEGFDRPLLYNVMLWKFTTVHGVLEHRRLIKQHSPANRFLRRNSRGTSAFRGPRSSRARNTLWCMPPA